MIVYALNPAAGRGAEHGVADCEGVRLVRGAGFAELRERTAAALAEGATALVVQGGDGMVSLGASLVAGTDVPLGVVPTGTGNDFARSAGIPRGGAARARSRLLADLRDRRCRHRRVDVLRYRLCVGDVVTEGVAVNSIDIGFDALVNERANELRHLSGTARYLVALARSVREFESAEFEVALDGAAPERRRTQLLALLNGRTVGGGVPLIPQARIDDGLLDVLTVSGLGRPGLLVLFPLAMLGLHRGLPPARFDRGRRLRVEVPAGVPIYADGERLRASGAEGAALLEARVDPGALRLVRHA